jgi:oxygen-independent coproporphyrinogen III oxidase
VRLSQADEIAETLIMSLRLTQEGVGRAAFRQRFGVDVVELHAATFTRYQEGGLLEITPERVRLTQRGRLLANLVLRELV